MHTDDRFTIDNQRFLELKALRSFNAQRYVHTGTNVIMPYNRRDFYKIWTVSGDSIIHYGDRSIPISQPALIVSNPLVPYSFESSAAVRTGYMCIFTEDFLTVGGRQESLLHRSALFRPGSDKVFFPDANRLAFIHTVYEQILAELVSDYAYQDDLLRSYVNLLIHESLKMQPTLNTITHPNAATRITTLFLELLERQFPIEAPDRTLTLKKASDYADNLAIHVNHLNHAVKEITGKSTSTLIAERIIHEAKALLKHTDWSISSIAYSLGFEYATYFNNFFKKYTGVTPLSVRKQVI